MVEDDGLVDGYDVGDAVTRVDDNSRAKTWGKVRLVDTGLLGAGEVFGFGLGERGRGVGVDVPCAYRANTAWMAT